MKTITLSKPDMERRIARFRSLKPLPIQNPSIPEKARDVTLAVCPPGQGPSLHSHRQTYETFTVPKGCFE